MRYTKPEVIKTVAAHAAIMGSLPKMIDTQDNGEQGTVAAYPADE